VRTRPVLAAALAGAALFSAAPAQAGNPRPKTVRIYDNYYLKDALTVRVGTTVIWRWPGFEEAGDVHDVKLKSAPRGVKKFHSEAAATDFSFRRKLKVAGKYKIVCTLHEEMTMTIRVRR
jgi:plastocyanin